MKEQFRNWSFRGDIRISYSDNEGNNSVWVKNQAELLKQINGIVSEYLSNGMTLTNRQLYYQLVSAAIIPNADKVYKRICKFLTDARYAGLIDWEAIEDRGRVPTKHSEWDNISGLINSAVDSYRLPRWSDQDYYIELYCEKQAMESVLKPIANKYHIYFGSNKGYGGAAPFYDLSKRLALQIIMGKKVVLLYLGDHDPSGLDMVRDIRKRLTEFLIAGDDPVELDGEDADNPNFRVIQLALNMTQINKYKPPPNPAKITDPRAKWYISEHGQVSWELDALKPDVLMQITTDGIEQFLDNDKYQKWIDLENSQKKSLRDFGKKLDKENGD